MSLNFRIDCTGPKICTDPQSYLNKSAQSNLGRGPRCGAVTHIRRKVPIGYNGAPQIRPKSTPSRVPISKPHYTCLIPGPVRPILSQTASGSDPPFFHNALNRPTDGPTDRPTDRSRESLTTMGRCAPRATRPNNTHHVLGYVVEKTTSSTLSPTA